MRWWIDSKGAESESVQKLGLSKCGVVERGAEVIARGEAGGASGSRM